MSKYKIKNISRNVVTLALLGRVYKIESGDFIEVELSKSQLRNVKRTSLFVVKEISQVVSDLSSVKENIKSEEISEDNNIGEVSESKVVEQEEIPDYNSFKTAELRQLVAALGHESDRMRRKDMIDLLIQSHNKD